ncbi:flavin reductase family protein [Thermopolyspora sp. NPDC052614]|uniref:flavin reductase family protein n=1 Tax=Thermopolyspora sp. NPDC052614 TaxID=3155682 RepID=UPI00344783E6
MSTRQPQIAFSAREFRDTLGHFASGVTVVTAVLDGVPAGLTCQSFFSVSLEPPLVSFSVAVSSLTYPVIRDAGAFCVNVLAHTQRHVSDQFARSGGDKWRGIAWRPTAAGNPVIEGAHIWIDCLLEAEHRAGDHHIVIGRVRELGPASGAAGRPLLYYRGGYHTFG